MSDEEAILLGARVIRGTHRTLMHGEVIQIGDIVRPLPNVFPSVPEYWPDCRVIKITRIVTPIYGKGRLYITPQTYSIESLLYTLTYAGMETKGTVVYEYDITQEMLCKKLNPL